MLETLINTVIVEALILVLLAILILILVTRRSERKKRTYILPSGTDSEEMKKTIERLQLQIRKLEHKPVGKIALILLLIGFAALVSSVLFVSSILVVIGLGLSLCGVLILLIKPVHYVRRELLDSTIVSSLIAIDRILTHLNYQGKGVYLPPASLRELKEGVLFISASKEIVIPSAEQVSQEIVFTNPHGIYMVPLGQGLMNLFEEKLATDFSKTDLDFLKANLPKLLVEDLEILKDFEMSVDGSLIHVKMFKPIYSDLCKKLGKTSKVCSNIGCPLCSSIACVLAETTSKAVVIEKSEFLQRKNTIDAWYRLIED